MVKTSKNRVTAFSETSNGGQAAISAQEPYRVSLEIEGVSKILFHAWNCESVDEKAASAKGSKAKKTDDVESYVYRNAKGEICIPGEYLRMAIIGAAKFRQDPRSPRKSAMDLYKAGVVSLTDLASLGTKDWDFLDRRRVMVQRNGINRTRPGMLPGWKARFDMLLLVPEYIRPDALREVVINAGRLVGIGDHRPSFGRFSITSWSVNAEG